MPLALKFVQGPSYDVHCHMMAMHMGSMFLYLNFIITENLNLNMPAQM